jgi:hypothetical protein
MTGHQGRHHAARPQGSRWTVGLPRPGQALIGIPERELTLLGASPPEPSLFEVPPRPEPVPFGVPRQTSRVDVHPAAVAQPHRPRIQGYGPGPVGTHHRRLVRLGLPIAVLTLAVTLCVITVVTLTSAMS